MFKNDSYHTTFCENTTFDCIPNCNGLNCFAVRAVLPALTSNLNCIWSASCGEHSNCTLRTCLQGKAVRWDVVGIVQKVSCFLVLPLLWPSCSLMGLRVSKAPMFGVSPNYMGKNIFAELLHSWWCDCFFSGNDMMKHLNPIQSQYPKGNINLPRVGTCLRRLLPWRTPELTACVKSSWWFAVNDAWRWVKPMVNHG